MPFDAPPAFRTRPDLAGTFGMAASTHWIATATAQSVLERGGNAFDAAVAAGFVLHVVEPHLNGPGGDMTAVFHPSGGRPRVLMGQGPAPAGATVEHFRREGLELVPGAGALAAAVPGAVDAWLLLLRDHGTWPLRDVLAYAIGYARGGHPLTAGAAVTIASVADLFRAHWPTSAERWLVDGRAPEPGTLVRNPAYAAVLEELVAAAEAAPSECTASAPSGAAVAATARGWAAPLAGAVPSDAPVVDAVPVPDAAPAETAPVPETIQAETAPTADGERASEAAPGLEAARAAEAGYPASAEDGGARDAGWSDDAGWRGGATEQGGPAPGTGEPANAGSNPPDPSGARGISGARDDAVTARAAGIDAARDRWRRLVGTAAEDFVQVPHRHADGADHAGVMTAADIAGFAADTEAPVTATFRGWTLAKTGPWGQGPVLLQTLKILEGFEDDRLDPSTALGVHTITEALKLAFADREAWYGEDLDAESLAHLLSDGYAAERRALIGETASHELRPGALPGRPAPTVPPLREEGFEDGRGVGEPTVAVPRPDARHPVDVGQPGRHAPASDGGERHDRTFGSVTPSPALDEGAADGATRWSPRSATAANTAEAETDHTGVTRGDTCHLDVVDRWGNMISATPSGGWLQSSPTIPSLGFCLGTRLQMTWLDDDSPSRLAPGRRPRTTLTPTLVLRDGRAVMALGSPGGDQQDQWQLLLLLRVLVGGYTPQQGIDAPAFHTTSFPGSFWPRTATPGGLVVEERIGDDVIRELTSRGHVVTRAGDWSLGRLSAVTRDPATSILGAAANPRGAQGYAAGR